MSFTESLEDVTAMQIPELSQRLVRGNISMIMHPWIFYSVTEKKSAKELLTEVKDYVTESPTETWKIES